MQIKLVLVHTAIHGEKPILLTNVLNSIEEFMRNGAPPGAEPSCGVIRVSCRGGKGVSVQVNVEIPDGTSLRDVFAWKA